MLNPRTTIGHPLLTFHVALSLTLACGPGHPTMAGESTTTDAASTSTSPITTSDDDTSIHATCPDHPQTDACCCFEIYVSEEIGPSTTQSVCGARQLCPGATFYCQDPSNPDLPCPSEPFTMDDVAALDCTLQALVDAQPGSLSWAVGSGFENTFVFLNLVGDGTAFRQGYHSVDLCFDTNAVQHLTLPPPTYFSGCLEAPDWQTRLACLRAAPFAEPLATCLDGLPYTDPGNSC